MKKLIRLKPLNPFFFGTNKTFSDDTLHDVVSSYFPQQTHILGMLRYFILQSNGCLKLKKRGRWVSNNDFKKAFSLVGGFDKEDKQQQKEESFGIINTLSPVFIVSTKENKIDDFHFMAPKDVGLDVKSKISNDFIHTANIKRDKHYSIENYNPKRGYINALTSSHFWKDYLNNTIEYRDYDKKIDDNYLHSLKLLSFDDVFNEVNQVGIKRDLKTKTVQADDEGSFYHKTSYVFKENNYEFACIVDVKEDFKEKESFVYLGAERSSFTLTIEDYTEDLENLYPKRKSKDNKLVLLSDMQIDDFSSIEFMINDGFIAHAHMQRSRKKQRKATGKYNKSNQQYFLPRGSVIYVNENTNLAQKNNMIGYEVLVKEEK